MTGSLGDRASSALALGDVDELCAVIDGLALEGAWDEVVELRDACRAALQRGVQAWPAAAWAEYRMALDGPGRYAAMVLDSTAERFALGPFSEVAASTHSWDDLAQYLSATPGAAAFAQERVLRGDDLRAEQLVSDLVRLTDLPWVRCDWEVAYDGPVFSLTKVDDPSPRRPDTTAASPVVADPGSQLVRDRAADALLDLVEGWRGVKDRLPRAGSIDGDGAQAGAALTSGPVRWVPLDASEAQRWVVWTAATDGSARRRRGGAAGRASLWWTLQCLGGLEAEDDVHRDELGEIAANLRWGWFDPVVVADRGWLLRISADDVDDGFAWAVDAQDVAGADRSEADAART